ncbi:MAG: hypothetical protein KDA45_06890, partial [Planctomycetales bacterium]|nr:hypothetical protein [Planctomycetales bacterium]
MMSMKAVAISAGMLLALFGSSPLWGQPPRHPPGGGRDPFFEALREVHQESPNKELFDLLEYPDIRDEVRLSAEKAEQIQENIRLAIKELFALRASRQANSEPHKSKEELKAEIAAAVAPFDDASYALLEQPPTELDRLLGIYVQARGNRAVLNEKVAHRIGLNATELDQLRKARTRIWRGIMQQAREDIQREIRNRAPGKEDLRKEFSKHIRHAER